MTIGIFLGYLAAAAASLPAPAAAKGAGAVRPADWLETGLYRLRLEGLRRCSSPTEPAAADPPAPASTWIAFEVRAVAKAKNFVFSPRDFTLETKGIILPARHVNTPLLAGCTPPLKPATLRAQQAARGFVLFEVPARLARAEDLVLAYRPTRWGGADRVQFPVSLSSEP